MTKKTCITCKKELPLTDFHKPPQYKKDGRRNECRWCRREKRPTQSNLKRSFLKREASEKTRAQQKVRDSVRKGKILKPNTCSRCNEIFPKRLISGHHYKGYEHPLEVIWLCIKCHMFEHIKTG